MLVFQHMVYYAEYKSLWCKYIIFTIILKSIFLGSFQRFQINRCLWRCFLFLYWRKVDKIFSTNKRNKVKYLTYCIIIPSMRIFFIFVCLSSCFIEINPMFFFKFNIYVVSSCIWVLSITLEIKSCILGLGCIKK